MKMFSMGICLLIVFMCLCPAMTAAHELSGFVAAEGRLFPNDPGFSEQEHHNASFALQSEYYHEWENSSAFACTLFARLDSADGERTHADVRELNYLWVDDSWELRVGIGKVFWGVTEFVHLVDIINQTDGVESIDGEDKLGQPMAHLSVPRDWGIVDLFVLPYFRERTFPGREGRLRSAPAVDTDHARYENGDEERHADFAIRYSHSVGDWDFGIYHFRGTGREPTLLPDVDDKNELVLIPYYEQIRQTGLDVQLIAGEWLMKLESICRHGQGDGFFSLVGGFEYSFRGIFETRMDLGVITEMAYDDRGDESTTSFENDIMFGLRLTANDVQGTEVLAGMTQDMDSSSRAVSFEASRRFGDQWKAFLEAGTFFDMPEDELVHSLREDHFICFELSWYF